MGKTKVLHLVEDLKIGGLERIIASIVVGLDRNKYDVKIWCLARGGQIAEELIDKGMEVKILGMNTYYNPSKIIALSRLFRKEQVDILHTHGYFGSTFGRLAAILARVGIIVTHVHTTYHDFNKRNILIERFLSLFTEKIICISEAVKKFVVEIEGINEEKTCLIYNGIDPPQISSLESGISRRSFGFSNSDFVIITVASLTPHKGHQVLIDAIKIVSSKYDNLRLLIVGEGILRHSLEAYAKRLQIFSNVVFTGQRKEVAPLLKIANLFILPSTEREGLGIALIEAMAAGLPVIGTRLGGIPEVIEDQINGFLVTPANSEELASFIERLITDLPTRDKMGEMGRKIYTEKFTSARMINDIESLYDNL
jgi:glycosyltransferase involved in cell wall biosynthesis